MNTNYNSFYNRLVSQGVISKGDYNRNYSGNNTNALYATDTFSKVYSQAISQSNQNNLDVTNYESIFQKASEEYGVPVSLLKAVAKAESGFNANAVSSCGAQGVMQLMPGTAAALGVTNAFDAEQNIMGGAKYLKQMIARYDGDVTLALAAYNAGAGNVKKYGGVPPFKETQNYIAKVLGYAGENIQVPQSVFTADNQTSLAMNQISSFEDNLYSSALQGSQTGNDNMATIFLLELMQMRNQTAGSIGEVQTEEV